MNIGIYIVGIGDVMGGGGAERFFADFYDLYKVEKNTKHNLFFITDKSSVINLNKVGKLSTKKGVLKVKIFSNRFKTILESIQMFWFIFRYNIKILHLPLYNLSYIPILKNINRLPRILEPKIVINISNCYIVPYLSDTGNKNHYSTANTYLPLFNEINVCGYFSWYKNFEEFIVNNGFKKRPKKVYSITSRFSDVRKFYPEEKKNTIVFASRLDEQKHPEWFIDAIHVLNSQYKEKIENWSFIICGKGPLFRELKDRARLLNIENRIDFRIEGELQKILNHSSIYVSCQDYENFPSLSMAEAMASGNAIIARNVGQTELFLRNNENGLFIEPESSLGLAMAILKLITSDSEVDRMGKQSVHLMRTVHNFKNFQTQIDNFWTSLN